MKKDYYFSTKDLLFIAGFSAIGGVASTYINMIGDFFQSLLGFAGTTQWAAGLHIVWILLAVGIVKKPGAAVLVGTLKGVVEFLSGNTHGVLVLIVDVAAGLIVELVFLLPILNNLIKNCLAGGLAAMSNVFVFQLFASVPADTLAFWSLLVVAGLAFLSGIIFGGLLSQIILKNLAKTGIISEPVENEKSKWFKTGFVLLGILLCIIFAFIYVQISKGEGSVHISGNIANTQEFTTRDTTIEPITIESTMQGMAGTYTGYPLKEILSASEPAEGSDLVLVTATDGYSYFIPMEEVKTNSELIIVVSGEGEDASYNVIGANNSKAWVRGVEEIVVIQSTPIPINYEEEVIGEFHAQDWQYEMDSVRFALEEGNKKLQGVAVNLVLGSLNLNSAYSTVEFISEDEVYEIDIESINIDDSIRIFANMDGYEMKYLVGNLQGEIFIQDIELINLK